MPESPYDPAMPPDPFADFSTFDPFRGVAQPGDRFAGPTDLSDVEELLVVIDEAVDRLKSDLWHRRAVHASRLALLAARVAELSAHEAIEEALNQAEAAGQELADLREAVNAAIENPEAQ